MDRTASQLYGTYPDNSVAVLEQSLEKGLQAGKNRRPIPVFFRADDIGVLSHSFAAMLKSFSSFQVPLCLAVVPAWITQSRWSAMAQFCDRSSSLWCWHQHGWNHHNHEVSGKKYEFGPSRTTSDIKHDLVRGRDRLQDILGPMFSPYFTPPWNRCSFETIRILGDTGFKALSRSSGAQPESSPLLSDLNINVDLHTRKELNSADCLAGLAGELEKAAYTGRIGIMIHHQRMNGKAFELLDGLLDIVSKHAQLNPVHFSAL